MDFLKKIAYKEKKHLIKVTVIKIFVFLYFCIFIFLYFLFGFVSLV